MLSWAQEWDITFVGNISTSDVALAAKAARATSKRLDVTDKSDVPLLSSR